MTDDAPHKLTIKKYANRRFYDTARSCHVTLGQMYDLIQVGHELEITDAKTGDDITNAVLTQILLERDTPKLGIFPSSVLHEMIRTQQEYLGSVVERFFAQVLSTQSSTQEQWTRFVQNTLGASPFAPVSAANPMAWAESMMKAFVPGAKTPSAEPPPVEPPDDRDREVEVLREQVATLTRLIERLADDKGKS
jgi:polyhydroxyalkanoate synthesis repressor PhaR